MKQVKIVPTDEMAPHQIEETLNEILAKIHKDGGYVEKTEYCIERTSGTMKMVVIEYEE